MIQVLTDFGGGGQLRGTRLPLRVGRSGSGRGLVTVCLQRRHSRRVLPLRRFQAASQLLDLVFQSNNAGFRRVALSGQSRDDRVLLGNNRRHLLVLPGLDGSQARAVVCRQRRNLLLVLLLQCLNLCQGVVTALLQTLHLSLCLQPVDGRALGDVALLRQRRGRVRQRRRHPLPLPPLVVRTLQRLDEGVLPVNGGRLYGALDRVGGRAVSRGAIGLPQHAVQSHRAQVVARQRRLRPAVIPVPKLGARGQWVSGIAALRNVLADDGGVGERRLLFRTHTRTTRTHTDVEVEARAPSP